MTRLVVVRERGCRREHIDVVCRRATEGRICLSTGYPTRKQKIQYSEHVRTRNPYAKGKTEVNVYTGMRTVAEGGGSYI